MWGLEIPVVEKAIRSVVVYVFVLLAFRLMGKRQVGQLSPFDLVVLLILANVLQNAAIGRDNSLAGGLLGATLILGLNYLLVEVSFRSKRVRHLLEARPTLLVHNGKILTDNLRQERVTLDELHAALRRGGVLDPTRVRVAMLEENGSISVILREEPGGPPA